MYIYIVTNNLFYPKSIQVLALFAASYQDSEEIGILRPY